MKKKYWFTLCSSVFIWKKNDKCIFYDSDKFISRLFSVSDSNVEKFVDSLIDVDNLYCISLGSSLDDSDTLRNIVDELINLKIGNLVEQKDTKQDKPIQFPPILNLQSDVNKLKKDGLTDMTIGENVLNNLSEVTLVFLNEVNDIKINSLIIFLDSLSGSFVNKIIILGYTSDLIKYKSLWQKLDSFNIPIIFNFELNKNTPSFINSVEDSGISNIKFDLIIHSNYDINNLNELRFYLQSKSLICEWEFKVLKYDDLLIVQELRKKIANEIINIKPFYNGDNIHFFEKYIYLKEDDFQNINVTKKKIFAHQVLNTDDFGKLIINSDGYVHTNIYLPPIGTVEDDIRELLYHEMYNGKSWLKIRDMEPCCNCVYQWLCPSPSAYEILIGKPNLCYVPS